MRTSAFGQPVGSGKIVTAAPLFLLALCSEKRVGIETVAEHGDMLWIRGMGSSALLRLATRSTHWYHAFSHLTLIPTHCFLRGVPATTPLLACYAPLAQ